MNSLEDLEKLPDIDMLADEGITLESIQEEMIVDYQNKYEEVTNEEMVLYPANPKRLEMNVIAGQLYQIYEFASFLFKQNFIKYMQDDVLWNWGGNLGFSGSNLKSAECILEFGLNEALTYDVRIPAGTRATAGDDVFFASDEICVIPAGDMSACVSATCTQAGIAGNEYMPGQINVLVDPVVSVGYVKNTSTSSGGRDEYSGDELREKIYQFPSTYSCAGPEDAYASFATGYDSRIIDVKVVTDEATSTVCIYVMLENGILPDESFCENLKSYLRRLKRFPDTDRIFVYAPNVVNYTFDATYFISSSNKGAEDAIRESVEEAAQAFVRQQSQRIGYDINPDIFKEYARVAGAKRTVVSSPEFRDIVENEIAICESINLIYGGLEDD